MLRHTSTSGSKKSIFETLADRLNETFFLQPTIGGGGGSEKTHNDIAAVLGTSYFQDNYSLSSFENPSQKPQCHQWMLIFKICERKTVMIFISLIAFAKKQMIEYKEQVFQTVVFEW